MNTTIINEIIAFLFGRKYYANIISIRGTSEIEICQYVFKSLQEAKAHQQKVESTITFNFIETVSFRSRKQLV
jgi:hypothetical protein